MNISLRSPIMPFPTVSPDFAKPFGNIPKLIKNAIQLAYLDLISVGLRRDPTCTGTFALAHSKVH